MHRRHHHGELTFRSVYAFSENFVLPLSHDEVVHGKGSLLTKMPGDDWQRFANLRLLCTATSSPSRARSSSSWAASSRNGASGSTTASSTGPCWASPPHDGVLALVADLNRLHRTEPALHELDSDPRGFAWTQPERRPMPACLSFLRQSAAGDLVLVVCNFTPVVRDNVLAGVPVGGYWRELLNSDAVEYGGSGVGNLGGVASHPLPNHGMPHTLTLTVPPLACLFLQPQR